MEQEECPICGINVKVTNLPRHLRKVHPNDESGKHYARELEKELLRRRPRRAFTPSKSKKVAIGLVVIIILLASLGLVSLWYLSLDRPEIEVNPSSYDFGNIQREVVSKTFEIRNSGKAELKLTQVSTSCGCTTAVVKARGIVSPVFGLHNNPKDWSIVLLPGETAALEVTYDAELHPDTGLVHRVVYIKSNDPMKPEAQVDIWANVIP